MRIKIVTVTTTVVETKATLEEARAEILTRIEDTEQHEQACEDVIAAHGNGVVFDEVIMTSTELKVVADE